MESITTNFTPSLVINITDKCNMDCIYCPPYGENLCQGQDKYDISAVKVLIKLAKQNQFKTVRFTGGEPLLLPERVYDLLDECGDSFERLVLNTNGVLLNKHFKNLEKYKKTITLKISMDSLNSTIFGKLTRSDFFDCVYNNINIAKSLGFKVEINIVLVNQSLEDIKQSVEFFTEKKVPIKLLTFSNYFNNVNTDMDIDLDGLINYLESISEDKVNEQLNGGRGISMLKYNIHNTSVLFVDHSCKLSKTPIKCYFHNCEKECNLFPCDCGVLSISLNTNGYMSTCRGYDDMSINVFNEIEANITESFNLSLLKFNNCLKINVNNLKL